uniref:Uncharacterized protein n=1 Tax=Chelydra serpentina TaxID=8475 RepID=A0A8C3T276_CHESE
MTSELLLIYSKKKRLIELNMTRDSLCMVEGKGDSTWIRPQRRHFPQSNRSSLENYKEKEPELDTGRSSWTTLTPLYHKERRHFPERIGCEALFQNKRGGLIGVRSM